ncbi:NAD(P)-dependent alcohol dehydrogenase [Macrococcoides canis]|jgi:zinc-binding alcohol dehydrogenase/oxidoreductase|uniref:Zinc-binding alcohol dehydrogenase/oxidoreductase n=1 Tax=Abyssicoccus albus TaxID=1817405 RepID=A0A3N5BRN8_9BACL|nr:MULTISPECIES: zinc-binding dehydrogenase [Staphylococcaceae]RPF57710.1 zinc-binding alcohol dehydrogenase/oxidoreductase [Abyssicoccus albus]TDM19637.1 NAD(P)-dependent alcohol dehydrogenase [Macrococcus canis]TDM22542.1 NAD(P)-dependent alcohol dehydrogenase [Macrococcus canis]TDM35517.1 NAD(P)-dependent alcohol dehydrogenase [Macrococcus canis]
MKAVYHQGEQSLKGVKYGEVEIDELKDTDVKVKLKTAGLNHRDLFIPGRHNENDSSLVLGSDGAGVVEEVGSGVDNVKVGDEVIINPALGWKENDVAPPEGFEIVGFPFNGTFSEYIVLPGENVLPKPGHLNWQEAGVLALSAMTAYRALFTRAKVKEGMTVLIPGATGGAGTFLLQFAKAAGAEVFVTSRDDSKMDTLHELGADKVMHSESDWDGVEEGLDGEKVDVVIESVGAATFNKSVDQLKRGGTLVAFGASAGDTVDFNLRKFFYGQYNLLGSTMASTEELEEMLKFIEKHNIKPVMDESYPLDKFEAAFDRLDKADMMGKIVFTI